jgi:phage shock protein PspC (stress-responsive transcriptional regulator)
MGQGHPQWNRWRRRDTVHGMNTKTLTRSTDDKLLTGVAGGLGEYFGVDPVLFRVGFVAATLLSGVGALAYLALVLLVKTDDELPVPA